MTDIRVGDIVEIERGKKGELGYSFRFARVVDSYPYRHRTEVILSDIRIPEEGMTVRVIKRAKKYRTALVNRDGELLPVFVGSCGDLITPTAGVFYLDSSETKDSLIETCPYVPQTLIDKAEEWWKSGTVGNPADILDDIVEAVRYYRDGDTL